MSAREVRLRHAKRLARFAHGRSGGVPKRESTNPKRYTALESIPRRQRSARLVSSSDSVIYSMVLEQCRSLAVALQTAAPRTSKACALWCDVRRADELSLLRAAIAEIELCLGHRFGGGACCSYIGLLDPGAQSLTYVAANQEHGTKTCRIEPNNGVALKCLNSSETVIIESVETAKQFGLRLAKSRTGDFPCICTPLRAMVGRPIGILTVNGLCSDATSLDFGAGVAPNNSSASCPKKVRTSPDYYDRLRPFVDKNDEGCKRVKLWRQRDANIATRVVAARVICGRVVDINRIRGIGSVYTVRWEDGCCETEISFRTMKDLLKPTPASLGVGIPCDSALLGFVEYAGRAIGEHLIRSVNGHAAMSQLTTFRLRSAVHAKRIISVPGLPNSTSMDLFNQCLQSAMQCILCARSAEIWEYDEHQRIIIIARMGPNLTLRQMCTPRRLLEIPGHKRHIFWQDVYTRDSFAMPHASEILMAPFETCTEHTRRGRLLVVTCMLGTFDSKDIILLGQLGRELLDATEALSLQERRATARMHALQRVSLICNNYRVAMPWLEASALLQIRRCFARCNVCLGALHAGGDKIGIFGHVEHRSQQSCVFECLPPTCQENVVVQNPARIQPMCVRPGTRVQVRYGRQWYAAVIQIDRGHLKYDIKYELKDWMGRHELEAGVSIKRLRRAPVDCPKIPIASEDPRFWPLLIAPLGCNRGILCMDSWSSGDVKPDYDESHVKKFLQSMGAQLGLAMDGRVRGCSLRLMWALAKDNKISREFIKSKFASLWRECTIFSQNFKLQETLTLTSRDLAGVEHRIAAKLLGQCRNISSSTIGQATFLIQASASSISFVSIFKDSKVVRDNNGASVERPNMSMFCS